MATNIAKKHFPRSFTALLLGALLVSCSFQTTTTPVNKDNIPTAPQKENMRTETSTAITTPTIELTSTPSPFPTTSEQATIDAFSSSICLDASYILISNISPNGKWISSECIGSLENPNSYLDLTNIDKSHNWKIYYSNFSKDSLYDHKDIIVPYYWSKDGRFLYAVAGTRISGCCWVGSRFTLLIRVNLETGEQLEILNATDFGTSFPFNFLISNSERYLFFTPPINQPYSFAILDLLTWDTQTINLEFPMSMDLYYAKISPKETKLVAPLFRFYEESSEFKLDSIALIDLQANEQKLLISDLQEKNLYPVRWIDDNRVLLSSLESYYWDHPTFKDTAEYWIIDTNTGELVITNKP